MGKIKWARATRDAYGECEDRDYRVIPCGTRYDAERRWWAEDKPGHWERIGVAHDKRAAVEICVEAESRMA